MLCAVSRRTVLVRALPAESVHVSASCVTAASAVFLVFFKEIERLACSMSDQARSGQLKSAQHDAITILRTAA